MRYQPSERTVLMCDFTGFIEPEMVKTRPVVVVKKHKSNPLLVTVVPLSATKPDPIQDYHYEFLHNPVPTAKVGDITWAKCDMVVTISLQRLDRFKMRENGARAWKWGEISEDEFAEIKKCIASALGIV